MNDIEKLRVILQHWIDHNGGHVAEFRKWQTVMSGIQRQDLVTDLGISVEKMNEVTQTLQTMLDRLGGPVTKENEEHHHHDHHGGHHHGHHHH